MPLRKESSLVAGSDTCHLVKDGLLQLTARMTSDMWSMRLDFMQTELRKTTDSPSSIGFSPSKDSTFTRVSLRDRFEQISILFRISTIHSWEFISPWRPA